jgi:16S rRNA (cytidine1402-2'-O)-methyltransferase
MSILYVVATPIGNLEDITLRALRVLREVKLIAAEDTRKTRRLLDTYDIKTPMTSYYEHNKMTKLDYILEKLKKGDVALVSEAGMPGISDPGYELIVAATRENIRVVPVPGPSAVTTALAVSSLPTDRFVYIGFLPNKSAARRRLLASVAAEPGTIIALEAPHRLDAALEDVLDVLGDRRLSVGRELTKLHEEPEGPLPRWPPGQDYREKRYIRPGSRWTGPGMEIKKTVSKQDKERRDASRVYIIRRNKMR